METQLQVSKSRATDAAIKTWLFLSGLLRLGLTFLLAALGLLLFVNLAFRVALGTTQAFDQGVVSYFQAHQPEWLHQPVIWLTHLADGPVVIGISLLAAAWLLWRRSWGAALALFVTVVGGFLLIEGLKQAFDRPRPEGIIEVAGHSFPSGHAFFSLTLYGFLAYQAAHEAPRRWKRFAWTLVILIALIVGSTRVLLGVHYPSDVLAGFGVAVCWLWGCLRLPRFAKREDWRSWKSDRKEALKAAWIHLREKESEVKAAARTALDSHGPALKKGLLWLAVGFSLIYQWFAKRFSFMQLAVLDTAVVAATTDFILPSALDPLTTRSARTLLLLPVSEPEAGED